MRWQLYRYKYTSGNVGSSVSYVQLYIVMTLLRKLRFEQNIVVCFLPFFVALSYQLHRCYERFYTVTPFRFYTLICDALSVPQMPTTILSVESQICQNFVESRIYRIHESFNECVVFVHNLALESRKHNKLTLDVIYIKSKK